ncbi:MAG TPA: aminomethyl-transferring glycine dehydrogenase subunit GcvPA [Gammaproteobacteria bacterium]
MPFIPHTDADVKAMLAAIGAGSIDQLFNEIPAALTIADLPEIPDAVSELEITRLMHRRAAQDGMPLCFIGAGAYERHIPAAVWQIAGRGEFYSAYTPYQPEASQGTLQLIYEYQTMMAGLTALDVSNASLYDGASALSEAILMALRSNRQSKSKKVLVAATVNPVYRATANSVVKNQNIELIEVDFSATTGTIPLQALKPYENDDIAAIVLQQPNFFGCLEDVDAVTDWAHQRQILVIGVCDPSSLALLKPPGEWGEQGADIGCGDGQPLGVPLASGGPYYGYICCKQELVRQMPGRIVGRTVDMDGRAGFVLTLQAREQHIRRSKATSNICTNQGLVVTASTIYMSLLGPEGLRRVATVSHANTRKLVDRLSRIKGVKSAFNTAYFQECVLQFDRPVAGILQAMVKQNILGGFDLSHYYPQLGNALLVCVTETKTDEDIERYALTLAEILKN